MVLKNLSDEQIEQNLLSLVEKERTCLTEVLLHIIQVEDRKIYLKRSYKSLHRYCAEVLKYPGEQAYRRIAAAQLLRECPAIQPEIESGGLNVTLLGQAKTYFSDQAQKDEPLTPEEKRSVIDVITGKSTRESEKIFAGLDPEAVKKDKVRVITKELTEIKFTASEKLMQKLQKFKDLDSHTLKNPNYNELFERLVDLAIVQKEKLLKPKVRSANAHHSGSKRQNLKASGLGAVGTHLVHASGATSIKAASAKAIKTRAENIKVANAKLANINAAHAAGTHAGMSHQPAADSSAAPRNLSEKLVISRKPNFILLKRSRAIPMAVKREVYLRDAGKCTFTDPLTGRMCESRRRIQYDHLHAFSLGGEHSVENLTLRCQSHNLFSAAQTFGHEKMRRFQDRRD